LKTTFEKEEMKLFIFWQNKQEKMKKYNLIEKQIYNLRKDEIVQLIRDLQIQEIDESTVSTIETAIARVTSPEFGFFMLKYVVLDLSKSL